VDGVQEAALGEEAKEEELSSGNKYTHHRKAMRDVI
jgi:hypothetical protein